MNERPSKEEANQIKCMDEDVLLHLVICGYDHSHEINDIDSKQADPLIQHFSLLRVSPVESSESFPSRIVRLGNRQFSRYACPTAYGSC